MSVRKDVCEKIKIDDQIFLSSYAGKGEDGEFGRRYGKYCRNKGILGKYEDRTKVYTSFRELYEKGFWGAAKRMIKDQHKWIMSSLKERRIS